MKRGRREKEKELLNVFDLTEKLLQEEPETRNSDALLIARYFKKYHGITRLDEIPPRDDVPSFETIRRARQRIQADGRCLPVQTVRDGRAENQVVFSEVFGR
jgi:hypothetical protein